MMDRLMGSGRSPDLPNNNHPSGSSRSPDLPSKKRKYNEGYHFITMVTNKRVEVFKYKDIAKAAVSTLLFYEQRGDFKLKGFIVMPDHIHMICESVGNNRSPNRNTPSGSGRSPDLPDNNQSPGSGRSPDLPNNNHPSGRGRSPDLPDNNQSPGSGRSPDLPDNNQSPGSGRSPDLPDIIRDIKKYIAKKAIEYLLVWDKGILLRILLPMPKKKGHTYQLWQPDYYDFNILSEKKFTEKLRYMYQNPLRKGLCDNIFEYEFSDIKRYFGSGDPKLPGGG
ncbi:MAG: hypothetical protein FJ106_10405 [Deltaproteobacteria bacterium]|nr:hypothetical protein [Deltaproteobacteria bacterium]